MLRTISHLLAILVLISLTAAAAEAPAPAEGDAGARSGGATKPSRAGGPPVHLDAG